MKRRAVLATGRLLLTVAGWLGGCASTPDESDAMTATFDKPVAPVHDAAVHALTARGFEITRNEPLYIEGFRSRKIGLFVGSGGETVGVWLMGESAQRTGVRIDTAKSMVGYVGQKDWTEAILSDMRHELGA